MNNMWLVARREFVGRGKSASYLITTLFVALLLLGTTLLPSFMESRGKTEALAIKVLDKTGQIAAPLQTAVQQMAAQPGARPVALEVVTGEEAPWVERAKTENFGLLIVEGAFPGAVKARFMAVSPSILSSAGAVVAPMEGLVRTARMQQRGLDPVVAQEVLQPMTTETLQISTKGEGRDQAGFAGAILVALGVIMVLYMVVLINGQFVFQGVLEEKVSRVVEVMAATVGPSEMLAGKVIGLGGLGLIQFVAMMAASTGGTALSNRITGAASAGISLGVAVLALVFLVLGYLLIATLMAAAASTISRMEDSQTVLMPLTMLVALPMIFTVSIFNNPNSTAAVVLSMVPFFSQSVMVLRVFLVDVPIWQIFTSLGLMVVSTIFMVWAGGRIYRMALLSYGVRPSFKQVLGYLRAR
jgi:ABC-2 type transport system permease protein